jgi:hypothetical protein
LASSDHTPDAKAIIEGLSQGKKGRYIHISGTAVLQDISNGYGNPSSKIYHDVADVLEITSFDESHIHRVTDAAVIASGEQLGIPTAIVTPCTIYGVGKGPINKRSSQVPILTEETLKRSRPFTVGAGNNYWDRKLNRDRTHTNSTDTIQIFTFLTCLLPLASSQKKH